MLYLAKLSHDMFNTPVGRYCWLRLPFGLKCSLEIFQRSMDQILEGIEWATAMMDDILVAGCDISTMAMS